jgi:hypothetical protein
MRRAKPGKKRGSRSPTQTKGPGQDQPIGLPTWPRLDLAPPELILNQLGSWGRSVLASEYIGDADRAVVEQKVQRLRSAEPQLLALLGRIPDLPLARDLLLLIADITGAAYVIGAHGGMTDTADRFFEKSRAVNMRFRLAKAKSERDQQLSAVIDGLLHGSPSKHPYKDADRLLHAVNRHLSDSGYKSLSRTTLYRHLRKRRQS